MIKIILSLIFVILYFYLFNKQRIIEVNPSVKMIKNVTYFDTENIYKLEKIKK